MTVNAFIDDNFTTYHTEDLTLVCEKCSSLVLYKRKWKHEAYCPGIMDAVNATTVHLNNTGELQYAVIPHDDGKILQLKNGNSITGVRVTREQTAELVARLLAD